LASQLTRCKLLPHHALYLPVQLATDCTHTQVVLPAVLPITSIQCTSWQPDSVGSTWLIQGIASLGMPGSFVHFSSPWSRPCCSHVAASETVPLCMKPHVPRLALLLILYSADTGFCRASLFVEFHQAETTVFHSKCWPCWP
jgi:hypothetical protein